MTADAAAPAIVADRFRLLTYAELRVTPGEWWTDPATLQIVMSALSAAARWRELDVLGIGYKLGTPIGSPADVTRVLAAGGSGVYNMARGEPRQAMFSDEADLWMQIGIGIEQLEVISYVGGDVLARLGPVAIDDLVDAIVEIRTALDGRAHVVEMHARPTAIGTLSYPRPLPDRRAEIPLSAVVDVVEIAPPADLPDTGRVRAARAIAGAVARADVPPGVSSVTRGKLQVLRWVDDPSSPIEVCKAATAHETWLGARVETTAVQPGRVS